MKKKLVAMLLAVSMVAGALTGCGNAGKVEDSSASNEEREESVENEESDASGEAEVAGVETSEGATPLTFWCISAHEPFYRSRLEAWNTENPDKQIDLDLVSVGGADRQSKLLVALQTGEGAPDFL